MCPGPGVPGKRKHHRVTESDTEGLATATPTQTETGSATHPLPASRRNVGPTQPPYYFSPARRGSQSPAGLSSQTAQARGDLQLYWRSQLGGVGRAPRPQSHPRSYLYFIPGCFPPASLMLGRLCTDSCPRLRATMATARKRPRVPRLGLLLAGRPSRSSGPRPLRPCSEHTKDTCMPRGAGPQLRGVAPLLPGPKVIGPFSDGETVSPKAEERRGLPSGARLSQDEDGENGSRIPSGTGETSPRFPGSLLRPHPLALAARAP